MDSASYRKIYGDSFEQDGRVIPLIYPEERTNGPYLCTDCGQTTSFILHGVILPLPCFGARPASRTGHRFERRNLGRKA